MGRIIGLIGGTCLLIAVVRLTNLQHDGQTLKADVVQAGMQPGNSTRDLYRRGKEMYLRGRYDQALDLLESVTASTSGLSAADQRQAEEYLARTRMKLAQQATGTVGPRGQSPDSDPFGFPPSTPKASTSGDPVADATKTRVERLMAQSVAAAKAGQRDEALKLAQQAFQLARTGNVKFARTEPTPAMLLQELQTGQPAGFPAAQASPSDEQIPAWALDTTTIKTAAAVDLSGDIELVSSTQPPKAATPSAGSPDSRRAQAQMLIESARADLKAGRLEIARRKALQAEELDVTYDLFDDRPELVLAEIDRRGGTMTMAAAPSTSPPKATVIAESAGPQAVASTPAAPQAPSTNPKAEATRLLAMAREDIKHGNYAAARQKAEQVQQLDVAYKLFEDRPELVLNDVAASMAASNIAQNGKAPTAESSAIPSIAQAGSSGDSRQQAKTLLNNARAALAEGRVDEARQMAIEADQLKASYGLFDDRPEILLSDIARAASRSPAGTLQAMPSEAAQPAANNVAMSPKNQAFSLMREARDLMANGQLEAARAKAEAADQLPVAYDVFDDRPELILSEIRQASSANIARAMPDNVDRAIQTANAQTGTGSAPEMAFTSGAAPQRRAPSATIGTGDDIPLVTPQGVSAIDSYNRGMAELSRGNRDAAYAAFQMAHQSGQRLDPYRAQRLQDYLRELSPKKNSKIQLTSQVTDGDLTVPSNAAAAPYEEPGPLDAAVQEQSIRFDRLRTDTLNAIFRAERMRESDPEQALRIVEQSIAAVEGANLGADATAALLRSLQKTHASLQNEIMRQQPNLDQKKKNEEVLALLDRDRNNKIRVEQEFASLVEEFNNLYQQKRFAEAEVIAKKAKELDPRNPVSETMFWKSRFARRNESNEQLKLAKEESFIKQLDEVEWATVANVGDNPIDFGSSWADITKRRKGKYGPDNRVRSEDEIRIQESLNRRISLHEENVPLSEVMQKIAALAGFNYQFDKLGLEEEGVTPSVPVTINVEGITVRSVLNLMLEQYKLGYMIQDEVLKITSRMRQQGDMVVSVYPVADLVIPIPNSVMAPGNGLQMQSNAGIGFGSGQFSVPTPMPGAGQSFAQIGNNPLGGINGPDNRLSGTASSADFNTLTDLISTTISPDSWADVGGSASIRQNDNTLSLVIRQTQKVHEEIADLLDQLRRLQDLQVTVEVRFVTVADRFFERIGIDFDFNIQPSVGGPNTDNANIPLLPFGSVLVPQAGTFGTQAAQGAQQQGQQAQQGQQNQQGTGGFFTPGPRRDLINRSSYPKTTVVGLSQPDQFSSTLDVPFRQGSFEVGVPDFGGFNPNAGMQVGMAILSDIEAFFFIQAAQGDERSNLLFAPKVTLFNGQTGTVISSVRRPFVISLIPTVGFFSTGFQPVIEFFDDGVTLTVSAVISADRRFVRLTVFPNFTNITDVFTFSFVGGTGGGQQGGQQQGGGLGQQGQGGGQGGFGGGGQGGFGGGQFGIGGGMGTSQMVTAALFNQVGGGIGGGGVGGGQGGQQNQQGQAGAALTVTVQQPVQEIVSVITTVSVPDGGTVLLGGIKRLREGRNMAGVPILNKIPYVSRLFKNTGVGRETESLMLMVTPRIIIQEEEEELLGVTTQ